eukprot:5373975-Prymnesium_polylepis.1
MVQKARSQLLHSSLGRAKLDVADGIVRTCANKMFDLADASCATSKCKSVVGGAINMADYDPG